MHGQAPDLRWCRRRDLNPPPEQNRLRTRFAGISMYGAHRACARRAACYASTPGRRAPREDRLVERPPQPGGGGSMPFCQARGRIGIPVKSWLRLGRGMVYLDLQGALSSDPNRRRPFPFAHIRCPMGRTSDKKARRSAGLLRCRGENWAEGAVRGHPDGEGAVCPHSHTACGAMEMMENCFGGVVLCAVDTGDAVTGGSSLSRLLRHRHGRARCWGKKGHGAVGALAGTATSVSDGPVGFEERRCRIVGALASAAPRLRGWHAGFGKRRLRMLTR